MKKKRAEARALTSTIHIHICIERFSSRVNERVSAQMCTYKHWAYVSQSASQSARAILVSAHATTTTCHTWVMVHSFHLLLLLVCCCHCRRRHHHCRCCCCRCCWNNHTKSAKNDDKHCNWRMKKKTTFTSLKWRNIESIFNCPFVFFFRNE